MLQVNQLAAALRDLRTGHKALAALRGALEAAYGGQAGGGGEGGGARPELLQRLLTQREAAKGCGRQRRGRRKHACGPQPKAAHVTSRWVHLIAAWASISRA